MEKELKIPAPAEYDGAFCPQCNKDYTVVGGDIGPDDNEDSVTRECSCSSCGATWTEDYALVGYHGLIDEEGEESAIPEGPSKLQQLREALTLVQQALANHRDGKPFTHDKYGSALTLEEVKYLIVDPLLETE